MLINPDTNKPAQEVLFSRKKKTQNHPNINLNNIQVERVSHQEHLGIILDEKLNSKEYIDSTILNVNRGIAIFKNIRYGLLRKSLITVYKALLRPLIDYGDIIYDQPHNESVCEKFESVQYKVSLAITGVIQVTSCKEIYQELGSESLRARRWYKCLSCMFKIVKEEAPNNLINLIPKIQQTTRTRTNCIPTFHCRKDCFKNYFFPSTPSDWYKLDKTIRNSESIGLQFLTGLGFSHLNEHRF